MHGVGRQPPRRRISRRPSRSELGRPHGSDKRLAIEPARERSGWKSGHPHNRPVHPIQAPTRPSNHARARAPHPPSAVIARTLAAVRWPSRPRGGGAGEWGDRWRGADLGGLREGGSIRKKDPALRRRAGGTASPPCQTMKGFLTLFPVYPKTGGRTGTKRVEGATRGELRVLSSLAAAIQPSFVS